MAQVGAGWLKFGETGSSWAEWLKFGRSDSSSLENDSSLKEIGSRAENRGSSSGETAQVSQIMAQKKENWLKLKKKRLKPRR
ncbi:hypothetical protein N780_08985 [Pontibacillus chungwhensis BH030062]|uniref:Uncharacterized protein n=1 Tax=Pontibacillus chungwhensis BH030062 TaxID=1385513 RepID=A0A0A2UTZ4_9BACI|nr:hypothetical protein N780_08985 [Pontibacillus chungwhensis BH030062]